MRARHGFTLVELLVVIGIIALLLGILLPVISRVRAGAQRTACRTELRDIGAMFQMYLNDSKNRLPHINTMPSMRPKITDAPALVEVLQPYHRGEVRVFRCGADVIRQPSPGSPAGFDTYFEREGSSYHYNPMLSARYAGRQLKDTMLAEKKAG